MNDAQLVNLRADHAEAAAMAAAATRPRVRQLLQKLESELAQQIAELEAAAAPPPPVAAAAEPAAQAPAAPATDQENVRPALAPEVGRSTTAPTVWEQINYGWDAGEYGTAWVKLYITLEGLTKEHDVTCDFTPSSFDLKIRGVGGRSYRLYKTNLSHDIEAEKSKVVVKHGRLIVKLAKHKSEYGMYDNWSELVAKRTKPSKGADPAGGIMDMMKDMYNSGDDQMRKVIGEAMMKSMQNPGGSPEDISGGL